MLFNVKAKLEHDEDLACDSSDSSQISKDVKKTFGWNTIGSLHQIR